MFQSFQFNPEVFTFCNVHLFSFPFSFFLCPCGHVGLKWEI
ncbi:unnamed protein product [Prunus brigantina]